MGGSGGLVVAVSLVVAVFAQVLCRGQVFFFFQAEDGIRDVAVTGVQTCALPIWARSFTATRRGGSSGRSPPPRKTARASAPPVRSKLNWAPASRRSCRRSSASV